MTIEQFWNYQYYTLNLEQEFIQLLLESFEN